MSRAMKDSGISWIGVIPKNWRTDRAKNIFVQSTTKGNERLVLQSATQDRGVVDKDTLEGVVQVAADADLRTFKTVHIDDFVISLRSFQGGFEICHNEGVISPAYTVFRLRKKSYTGYYRLLFKSYGFIDKINSLTVGIREGKNIQYRDFADMEIPIPSDVEQQRIAEFLDRKCGEIDEAIALQEEFIEELKAYKQSVITEAVTRGLNPNVKFKDSGIDWIGKIPKHWEIARIKNILEDSSLQTKTGVEEQLSVTQNRGIIKSSEIQVANPSMSQIGWKIVKRGDIVFNKYKAHSGVFFVSPYDGIVTFNYSVYHCREIISPHFYEYLFKTPPCIGIFRKSMKGVGDSISPLYTCDLFRIAIYIPPLDEQQQITNYLDTKCAEIDSLIAVKQQKIEELKDYKKSIIYEYVTGKKEVNG